MTTKGLDWLFSSSRNLVDHQADFMACDLLNWIVSEISFALLFDECISFILVCFCFSGLCLLFYSLKYISYFDARFSPFFFRFSLSVFFRFIYEVLIYIFMISFCVQRTGSSSFAKNFTCNRCSCWAFLLAWRRRLDARTKMHNSICT